MLAVSEKMAGRLTSHQLSGFASSNEIAGTIVIVPLPLCAAATIQRTCLDGSYHSSANCDVRICASGANFLTAHVRRGPPDIFQAFHVAAFVSIAATVIAYIGTVIVDLPTRLILRRAGLAMGAPSLLIRGFSLPVFLTVRSGELPALSEPWRLAIAPGVLVAGFWWLIASGAGPIGFDPTPEARSKP